MKGELRLAQSWYPGHMAKAISELTATLKLIDVVVEIVDSRAPQATSNPHLSEVVQGLPIVVVLNKADLADPIVTQQWMAYGRARGVAMIPANCQSGRGVREVIDAAVSQAGKSGPSRIRRRLRSAVVGIPNVGKSSFINRVTRRGSAKVGDRPGVTRAKQWIVARSDMEMLDTPGIMPTRVDDPSVWKSLAILGCIDDNLVDMETLSHQLITVLDDVGYPSFRSVYGIEPGVVGVHEILDAIGRRRGCMLPGGIIDTERSAQAFLRDMRQGKLGQISLERP